MKYNPDIPGRRSLRLKDYDYTQPGAYFVTIVAWGRECLFGKVVDGEMRLSAAGRIVEAEWWRLGRQFPNIRLDAFVLMPNHVHAIIIIHENANTVGSPRPTQIDPSSRTEGSPQSNRPIIQDGRVAHPPQSNRPIIQDGIAHVGATRHTQTEGSPTRHNQTDPSSRTEGSPTRHNQTDPSSRTEGSPTRHDQIPPSRTEGSPDNVGATRHTQTEGSPANVGATRILHHRPTPVELLQRPARRRRVLRRLRRAAHLPALPQDGRRAAQNGQAQRHPRRLQLGQPARPATATSWKTTTATSCTRWGRGSASSPPSSARRRTASRTRPSSSAWSS
jgi:REP element-mobilizing transposase RayT